MGASLLAMTDEQPPLISTNRPLSRAGSLPQGWLVDSKSPGTKKPPLPSRQRGLSTYRRRSAAPYTSSSRRAPTATINT
ncbi:hypothetical protein CUN61_11145 [Pseudomonas arsenicoxydans]|uniref:Uncharacterized protein n=1 Tax=Pseudomonas arsenicoxydans TaxID=702115 RepID=A0A4P6G4Z4_9PSED|nr:hypothetical protein CUN61_11145 [Pseudomonas arsenicoxydans]